MHLIGKKQAIHSILGASILTEMIACIHNRKKSYFCVKINLTSSTPRGIQSETFSGLPIRLKYRFCPHICFLFCAFVFKKMNDFFANESSKEKYLNSLLGQNRRCFIKRHNKKMLFCQVGQSNL